MSQSTFLNRPVDIAPLALFRILMGVLMAAEGWGAILTGWVRHNYVDPEFTFNFIGFDFLQVIVGPQAYVLYFLLGVAGIGIALGYRYRLSVAIYTFIWAAVYFGQKTSYNNHYYLLLLMCLLLWMVPAHRYTSLDVRHGRVTEALAVPYWSKWIFKILLLIVYVYAAIAKLYPDWLDGTTVGIFLSGKSHLPLLGPLSGEKWLIMLIAYGGIVFDFLVVPALWYRHTRIYAFLISIGFHIFNSAVFHIGIFPYMMLICTVLYFDQATIRALFFRKAKVWSGVPADYDPGNFVFLFGLRGSAVQGLHKAFIYSFLTLMLLLPLRPFYYPGSPHWSEEGHRLSWHMMLRSKSGTVTFLIKDADDKLIERVMPEKRLSAKMARSMATRPDMIWQYAQRLRDEYREGGNHDIAVYAESRVSLNGRPYRAVIDPQANLSVAKWSHLRSNPWILPHPDL